MHNMTNRNPSSVNGEKSWAEDSSSLPVVETFHSLQGEGMHAGRSAFFIRLAGCTVGCSWCDTKHSWPVDSHPRRPLAELAIEAEQAADAGAGFIVITGGEPLHHHLEELCKRLAPLGLPLHLETSGVNPLNGWFQWITLAPKRHKAPLPSLLACCQELKLVIHEKADLAFALDTARAANATGNTPTLLLQPGWGSSEGLSQSIAFIKANPSWRLSLQSHKYLGLL
jgi:7-carboxy-7-deazaguanine synthase